MILNNPYILTLIATSITLLLTLLGSATVFLVKKTNLNKEAANLAFAGGIMFAASIWSLITPSIELVKVYQIPVLAIFLMLGFYTISLIDKFLDQSEGKSEKLLFLAILIHNIPEGMAIGVLIGASFQNSLVSLASCIALTIATAIQNFPEGAAISLPLYAKGETKFKAFTLGWASAIPEVIAGLFGVLLVNILSSVLPFILTFTAGIMICVVITEIIPSTMIINKAYATYFFGIGFIVMMMLDCILG